MVMAKPIGADLEQTRGFWCQSGIVEELWVLSGADLVLWRSRGFRLWVLNGFWLGLILGFDCVGVVVVGAVLLLEEPWVLGWVLVVVGENLWVSGWFLVAGGAMPWVRICGLPLVSGLLIEEVEVCFCEENWESWGKKGKKKKKKRWRGEKIIIF
jgi:hypothetical protein